MKPSFIPKMNLHNLTYTTMAGDSVARLRFNRRFDLRAMLPRLARAMMLCKPHPEPVLRMASNFHD